MSDGDSISDMNLGSLKTFIKGQLKQFFKENEMDDYQEAMK